VVFNVSGLFAFYVGCEVGFGLFLTAFAVLAMDMPEGSAQYLTAAYWGAITVGRALAVPLSTRMAPATMMSLDVVGVLASLSLLVAVVLAASAPGLWLAVVLFGLCMASVYPTGVAILEAYVPLEGKHTTSLVIGGSAGEWLFPFVIASAMTADVAGGGAIAVSAADADRARWVFLGVNAACCLGLAAAYALLRRLGPALKERRLALGLAR
jgi:fucose permease